MTPGPRLDTVGVFSAGLMRLPGLATFLEARKMVFRPAGFRAGRLDAVAGWGHKKTADRARAYAARHGVPYLALEDGFLRSTRLGAGEPPLSLIVDDLGIYYDARAPSRLEALLCDAELDDLEAARDLRALVVSGRVSKYNHAPDISLGDRDGRPVVLVVDQTHDDASVLQGLADAATFDRMLEAARDEHPGARVLVKVHPATVSGHKRGYLAERALPRGVERLADPAHPIALLEQVDHVYVVTSQLGFEALMLERPVRCFGAPFYSGWGLTHDEVGVARRGRRRTLDELVAAALLRYPRYRHPLRDARGTARQVVEHLALQRRMLTANDRTFHCVGFSTWKRPFIRRYLGGPGERIGGNVRFVRPRHVAGQRYDAADAVVVWGARPKAPSLRTPAGEPVPVCRMEDGFLRSVRLGSELTAPGSLVLDRSGLYYDPRRVSDLERILQEASFSPEELERARRLRETIVALEVSKYNLAARRRFTPSHGDKRVVLVVGQVEDDASVELGSPRLKSNAALLRAVRDLRPEAHLVYKPHPDVLSGNRKSAAMNDGDYDEIVVDASLPACLEAADEVHTLTSLVGFEALLRQIPVTTHGQPFYAGWGLTDDRAPIARRTRRLSLDELVAGTLLRYPRYYSWPARAFCTAEDMVEELARLRDAQPRWSGSAPWLVRRIRDVAILSWEWLHD